MYKRQPEHGVTIHRGLSIDPELPGTGLRLTADGTFGFFNMECLQNALATRFGVNLSLIHI